MSKKIELAKLILIGLDGYDLEADLQQLTEENAAKLSEIFSPIGDIEEIHIGPPKAADDERGPNSAVREGVAAVLKLIDGQSDIILDASSLPRLVYVTLMTAILSKLMPKKSSENALAAGGVNFQVLVGEDPKLDAVITGEDPSNDVLMIPGFSSALQVESVKEWPLIWFPILGENRTAQFSKVLTGAEIPGNAEICPVLPSPSLDPRRADQLLIEYRQVLFDKQETPTSNIIYTHESNPFEAYRQILSAMIRYKSSMSIIGGSRIVVTPLGSKLITLGAALACFEMKPEDVSEKHAVAIPLVEPTRYRAAVATIRASQPIISSMLLTGAAFEAE